MATQTKTSKKPISIQDADSSTLTASQSRRAFKRFIRHRMAVIGSIMLVSIILFVVGGSLFYSEAESNFNDTSIRLEEPSSAHPFGTDTIGRDILARTIYGGQISLLIGVVAVTMMVSVGTLVGLISGYYGGIIDGLLGRLIEAMLSIPSILLLLVLSKSFGGDIDPINFLGRTLSGSVVVIVFVIGLTSWMTLARIVRSTVLSIRETEFVLAARALGASNRRIISQHILPNTIAPIIVAATLGIAVAILLEAYISFLGLGVQPPTATWGNMLQSARGDIENAPWLWIFPGMLITMSVMSINFVGDGLRDALDPRSDKKV